MKTKHYLIALIALTAIYLSGCKKDSVTQPSKPSPEKANEEMVLTPGGLMPKSHVFLIEQGYHLSINNGQVTKVRDITGETVAVLGKADQPSNQSNPGPGLLNQNNFAHLPGKAPTAPYPNGWQAYGYWHAPSTQNITTFSTTWTIPAAPTTNTGGTQLIYIFEGTSNDAQTDIIQPVLQWGYNGVFGNSSWTIANWYLWSDNTYAAYSPTIIGISPGTSLTGVISYNGPGTSGDSFTSSFTGHSTSNMTVTIGSNYNNLAGGTITLPSVSNQTWAYEALESYHVSGGSYVSEVSNLTDYPANLMELMGSINIQVNGSPASSFAWTTGNGTDTFGEKAYIINGTAAGSGEVDLCLPPVLYAGYGGRSCYVSLNTTSTLPNPGTYVLYYKDLTTGGSTQSNAGGPWPLSGYNLGGFTAGHTYRFWLVIYATGGSEQSNTQDVYIYS
jgi:hypothetical protein